MSTRTPILLAAACALVASSLLVSDASANPNNNNNPNHQIMPTKKPLIGSNPITYTPNKPLIGGNPISWTPHKPCGFVGCDPITWTPKHHYRPYWWPTIYPYPVERTVVVPGAARVVSAPAQPVASTPVAGTNRPGNCLTKQFMADGSLLFKDLCTNEFAVASPEQLKAEANGMRAPQ